MQKLISATFLNATTMSLRAVSPGSSFDWDYLFLYIFVLLLFFYYLLVSRVNKYNTRDLIPVDFLTFLHHAASLTFDLSRLLPLVSLLLSLLTPLTSSCLVLPRLALLSVVFSVLCCAMCCFLYVMLMCNAVLICSLMLKWSVVSIFSVFLYT